MKFGNCIFSHVFRASNKVVDALSNLGAFTKKITIWDDLSMILEYVCDLLFNNEKVLFEFELNSSLAQIDIWHEFPFKAILSLHVSFS